MEEANKFAFIISIFKKVEKMGQRHEYVSSLEHQESFFFFIKEIVSSVMEPQTYHHWQL